MLKRILTAAVALAILIPILLFAPDLAVQGLFSLLSVIAIYEIACVTGVKNEYGFWIPVAFIFFLDQCFMQVLVNRVSLMLDAELFYRVNWLLYIPYKALPLVLLFVIVYIVLRNKKLNSADALTFFAMSFYVTKGFAALEELCWQEDALTVLGSHVSVSLDRVFLWVALSIPWVADSLAYFAGRFFGKKKLCPDISPKKTVAGAVGGVVGTGVVYGLLYGIFGGWEVLGILVAAATVMCLAVASIFGDLFASVVKRHYGVKDYGNLFPGHGGVMDRFDSTIPVALLMALALPAISLRY